MKVSHGKFRRQSGFTLIETLIGTTLTSLIMLAAMSLFMSSMQTAARTSIQNQSSLDASSGLQYVLNSAREAYAFRLPGDAANAGTDIPAFTTPSGVVTSYRTTLTNGTVINTCIELIFPVVTTASVGRASATDIVSSSVYNRGLRQYSLGISLR